MLHRPETCKQIYALSFPAVFSLQYRITGQDTIVVGTDIDFPPYSYVDESGALAGLNVAVCKAIAQLSNLPIRIETDSRAQIRKALEEEHLDAVIGMFDSEYRRKAVD